MLVRKHEATSNCKILFFYEGRRSSDMKLSEQAELIIEKSLKFTGKADEMLVLSDVKETLEHTICIGLGEKFEMTALRKAAAKALKEANAMKYQSVDLMIEKEDDQFANILAETAVTVAYNFNNYKSDKKPFNLETVNLITESDISEGIALGEANLIARELVNEPANVMLPIELAKRAESLGETYGFDVEVYDEKFIQDENMVAYWNVAKASANLPRFIVMKYMNGDDDEILGLVGKGLTFDTGGYSLKPGASMITMKSDMGGSAAVIGAMAAIAKMGLKKNVIAVVAACENMISGKGYRPGDIISSRGGKSIFIQSTDAEGRLTLIDAVDYIIKDLKATKVVDIATLTGACLVALGKTTTGVVSNNDDFYKALEEASMASGEKVWRMPIFPEYKETLKHKEADLTNAVKMAGMITAGMFIGEFVNDTPWIHMDIAGTSWTEAPQAYQTYGGTGVGVKNLYYLAKKI